MSCQVEEFLYHHWNSTSLYHHNIICLTICCSWMDEAMISSLTPHVIGQRPNTYTFTKSLAEHIIQRDAADLPVAIFRPSIIGASLREPFPVSICITYTKFEMNIDEQCSNIFARHVLLLQSQEKSSECLLTEKWRRISSQVSDTWKIALMTFFYQQLFQILTVLVNCLIFEF